MKNKKYYTTFVCTFGSSIAFIMAIWIRVVVIISTRAATALALHGHRQFLIIKSPKLGRFVRADWLFV